jgi:chromosome segregation ATPase
MSFVGKLLVVVQVVLSICFMTFAGAVYSTHSNWKQAHATVSERLANAQADLAAARSTHQKAADDHQAALAKAEKTADEKTAEVAQLDLKVAKYDSDLESHERSANVAQEMARIAQEESDERNRESLELRKQNEVITRTRDDELKTRMELEDKLRAEEDKVAVLNSSIKIRLKDIALYQKALRQLGATADTTTLAAKQEPPPAVDGKVINVLKNRRGKVNLLEITIGSDDGLVEGHRLFIYRGDKYLGQAIIVQTSTDKAVAEMTKRAKTGLIKEGDIVTTKL